MQLNNRTNLVTEYDWPTVKTGNDPSVLTSIYQDNINIAIWQRQYQQALELYAKEWNQHYSSHSIKLILSVKTITDQLDNLLPDLENKKIFQQDITLLVDMFACLFDATEVGLRKKSARANGCLCD